MKTALTWTTYNHILSRYRLNLRNVSKQPEPKKVRENMKNKFSNCLSSTKKLEKKSRRFGEYHNTLRYRKSQCPPHSKLFGTRDGDSFKGEIRDWFWDTAILGEVRTTGIRDSRFSNYYGHWSTVKKFFRHCWLVSPISFITQTKKLSFESFWFLIFGDT